MKKSARWVPRLLSANQKKKQLDLSLDFVEHVAAATDLLERIVTMDESAVAFHSPETKEQLKQWLPKGTLGPLKAKVQASRKKQMVIVFFDMFGILYEHYIPIGVQVNAHRPGQILEGF